MHAATSKAQAGSSEAARMMWRIGQAARGGKARRPMGRRDDVRGDEPRTRASPG